MRPWLECVWEMQTGDASLQVQRIVPDGSVELIFHLGIPFSRLSNGIAERQPRAFVVGQSASPFRLQTSTAGHALGIRVRAEAARSVTGVAAAELTDRAIPMQELGPNLGQLANRILDRDCELETLLNEHLAFDAPPDAVAAAISMIKRSAGTAPMDTVAAHCNLSTRQLQRLFLEHVGISPKLFARIVRFQRVFQHLEHSPGREWVHVALDCGYSDQAHLIRDFRQFAGETPSVLLRAGSDLAGMFLRAKSLSHFSKPAA
jgi:AraC-like DNA-binding protein